VLNGKWTNWELIQRIALEIKEADWDEGPKTVAAQIARIEEDFWAEALPQHETVERDDCSGQFSIVAKAFDPDDAVERWLKQVEFAVTLAVDSNTSDFNRMCTAFKYIDHTLQNCRDDPNAVEQQFGIAKRIIESNLNDPKYQSDDSLSALFHVLDQTQMRADHPEVRKAWDKRIAQKLREVDRETKHAAAEAIRAETARTKGRLSTEMELDAETVETAESQEAQAIAVRRAGGRAAKMNAMERASKTIQEIDKSFGYKAVRIGQTGYTVGDIVWMLKDLLGL
jgi:hypothetical protein